MKIRRIAALRTASIFRDYLAEVGADLNFDEDVQIGEDAPLAQPYQLKNGFTVGNRFSILPMEGWDCELDGRPSDLARRRWRRFGQSGAKLIWGGEAVAVRHDGRANPNQLVLKEDHVGDIADLRMELVRTHEERFGNSDDLLIGLQLTHSGRFCKPNSTTKMEPMTAYRHPILDEKFGIHDDSRLMSDDDIDRLIEDFIIAAKRVQKAGFHFVDVKHCHGYLGHELLTAMDRPGKYGGSFENRTRFLRDIVAGIRAEAPGLDIGVRLSAFDFVPFRPSDDEDRRGVPVQVNGTGYPYAFGGDDSGLNIDLIEPLAFLDLLAELDIELVCLTAGSPYYTPHIQRPAIFPPSDGYQPPEDPLVGVARQLNAAAQLKAARPNMTYIGTGYSYLQEWLPHVAQHVVRTDQIDFVGIGRMVLSYPDLPTDVLNGRKMERKLICRTFSDCTTSPRMGMISGCFPLDEFYKVRPEAERLKELKQDM
ncbi:MAG: NADH:flavin oxidoreductase [Chloroflexota bacterium]